MPRLPEFVVLRYPAFREREPVVAARHPALAWLLALPEADSPPVSDSFDRDPMGARYHRYQGRWLAGFARVPETRFIVIFQTRDWVGEPALFAFIVATGTELAEWNFVQQRRQRMAPQA